MVRHVIVIRLFVTIMVSSNYRISIQKIFNEIQSVACLFEINGVKQVELFTLCVMHRKHLPLRKILFFP